MSGDLHKKKIKVIFTTHIATSLDADNESPTVNCPSPNTTNVDSGAAGATVFWSSSPTATDFGGVPIDPNTIVCEDSPGSVVVSGGFYQHGLTTVTCKANDTSLNEGSCSFMITVIGK